MTPRGRDQLPVTANSLVGRNTVELFSKLGLGKVQMQNAAPHLAELLAPSNRSLPLGALTRSAVRLVRNPFEDDAMHSSSGGMRGQVHS